MTSTERKAAKPMPPFITPLRRAILHKLKTETRRLSGLEEINKNPGLWRYAGRLEGKDVHLFDWIGDDGYDSLETLEVRCPYGNPGDVRYLREPLVRLKLPGVESHWAQYLDDGKMVRSAQSLVEWRWRVKKLTQLHLPKEYARTFVRLELVAPQRVWEMTEQQAEDEAVARHVGGLKYKAVGLPDDQPFQSSRKACFFVLFDELNKSKGSGRKKKGRKKKGRKKKVLQVANNPWTWRIKFTLL